MESGPSFLSGPARVTLAQPRTQAVAAGTTVVDGFDLVQGQVPVPAAPRPVPVRSAGLDARRDGHRLGEIGRVSDIAVVAVRDTKDRSIPSTQTSSAAWTAFIKAAKSGALDFA
ncbi:DUF397 domain-containing protein [Streptomyces sp. 8K308]|uniref:DUF397 domain-containing protein n=1 Tax=Streptomyces sp. 8K308 TaxID=2530388 RepID=UPI0010505AD6|nr:DUF397 domain-containing protein [Streptomyces sp. 8K308]TDC23223.1 DUF397 domain-containing protein [Streptomyces sp. 8K308]